MFTTQSLSIQSEALDPAWHLKNIKKLMCRF